MSFDLLKRLMRLSAPDRRLLFSAIFLLPLTGLGLRLLGLRRTYEWMGRFAPSATQLDVPGYGIEEARSAARLVAKAGRRMPYRVSCLREAMVLWWLLARRGIDARLVIGVGTPDNVFAAHAWVECGGKVLNDDERVRERFVPIDWRLADRAGRLA